jgi:hypothetical protein
MIGSGVVVFGSSYSVVFPRHWTHRFQEFFPIPRDDHLDGDWELGLSS